MSISWETLPYCAGKIVDDETGKSRLIQTDWDYPGVASSFGWSIREVQHCRKCRYLLSDLDPDETGPIECDNCGRRKGNAVCNHSGTDGTVDCEKCGLKAGAFISAAGQWLADNDGATADDPGYFA